MKKHLTYRTATILGWIGLALLVASIFIPRPWSSLAWAIGLTLVVIDTAASWHQRGYNKGRTEALKVEIKRVWAEQEPFPEVKEAIDINLTRVPIVQSFGPNPLEAELNRGLAADKAEEPPLWEALKESRTPEDSNGLVWGTDYWGDILSEPSESQARFLAKKTHSTLYSRQLYCEWVKVEEPRLCDSQNAQLSKSEIKWAEENFAQVYRGTERIFPPQPTAKEHRCQSCGELTDTTFCEPACEDGK